MSSYWCRDEIDRTLANYGYTDYTNAAPDLVALPNYQVYLKLMIDGRPSVPFSAATLGPEGPLSRGAL